MSHLMDVSYRLACRRCDRYCDGPVSVCPACGPTITAFGTSDPASGDVKPCCASCGKVDLGGSRLSPVPLRCHGCGDIDFGWKAVDEAGWWLEQIQELPGAEGRWVRADFDGAYMGLPLRHGGGGTAGHAKQVEVLIHRGVFRHLSEVDAPLVSRSDSSSPVIRHSRVEGVEILNGEDGRHRNPLVLMDFRLHDWQFISDIRQVADGGLVSGRLIGVAYGRRLPTVVPEPKPISAINAPGPVHEVAGPLPTCARCNFWLIASAFLLIWWVCTFKTALMGASILLAQCLLHGWLHSERRALHGPKGSRFAFIVSILGLLAFVLSLGTASLGECRELWSPWLLMLATTLLATAIVASCWPKRLLTALWVVAMLSVCQPLRGVCQAPSAGGNVVTSAVGAVSNAVVDAIAMGTPENGGSNPFSIGSTANDLQSMHRITIDQALDDPARYFSCRGREQQEPGFEIYFGDSALFALNSDELHVGSMGSLRKIAVLLERNPDAHVILTGHTDSSGEVETNLPLSERRARRVADWLENTAGIAADRMEVRGVANRYPVVNMVGPQRLNRRVEMRIDCRQLTAGGAA